MGSAKQTLPFRFRCLRTDISLTSVEHVGRHVNRAGADVHFHEVEMRERRQFHVLETHRVLGWLLVGRGQQLLGVEILHLERIDKNA